MNLFHHLAPEEVLNELSASRQGLTSAEALQRLSRWGPNRLPEARRKSIAEIFVAQFRSPFIYLLLAAGVVSVWIRHVADAVFIGVVLLLNASVGAFQEWRAESRAHALKALIRGRVDTWRDGTLQRLSAEQLVPGDIVQIQSGEKLAADLRVLEARGLMIDESLLTGESLAVQKRTVAALAIDAALADRVTMLHAGTTVRTGRGVGVVTATGARTVVGQLASALERPQPPPPLIQRMARFTRQIAVAMIAIIGVVAVLEWLRGAAPIDIFLLAIALAVSAIPEGLPVAMTVALSIATHRMGLRNVLVRHLPAVEGLGACTLIATDKTGTLTRNRLSIEEVWTPLGGRSTPAAEAAQPLLTGGARASEQPAAGESGGDAVDLAFFAAAGAQAQPGSDAMRLVARIPYEPEKRFAAVFYELDGVVLAYVKGAPETIQAMCADFDAAASAAVDSLSAAGYRTIAVAQGRVALAAEEALSGLHVLGIAALIDPLRPEAAQSVSAAQHAGVRVIMVTGDHPLTALAIGRQLELAHAREDVVTGSELAAARGGDLDRLVSRARVFARTDPLQKLAIVESLRRQHQVVAVTGDGVNDAPALHAADIGVAMGKGGTDVARDASDLILTDDNFASIVAGIEEGRIAHDNLRKVILLLISTGVGEILLMLAATSLRLPPPLTAVQLLWLNLVTNGLQDVALAFEAGEAGVLQRPPRPAREPIFNRRMIEEVAVSGATIGLCAFLFYLGALSAGIAHTAAQGATLWLLVWCENAHCFNCRSETRSALRTPLAANPFLFAVVAATQLIQIGALAVPTLRTMLSLETLNLRDGLLLGILAVVVLVVMEIYKRLRPISGPAASVP